MKKEVYEVIKERFHLYNPKCYIIQGKWPKKAEMQVFLDAVPLKNKISQIEIVSAMERFQDPDEEAAEKITAQILLPDSLEGYRKLVVYAKTPERKIKWFSISVSELKKKRNKPQFFIEEEKLEQGTLTLRGWAVGAEKVQIQLYDEQKKKIPVVFQMTDRADVEQMFEEKTIKKPGFFAEIPGVSGKRMYLVFVCRGNKNVHVIYLNRAEILREKAKKYIQKGYRYWKLQGTGALFDKTVNKARSISERPQPYYQWIALHLPDKKQQEKQRKTKFSIQPKISIVVPLYKTPEEYLKSMIASIQAQTYKNWELCLSDGSGEDTPLREILEKYSKEDARIRVLYHKEKMQISENTNAAIDIATGDFIAFADHDDELTPDALFQCVKAINEHPEIKVLYSDEDKMSMNGRKYFHPHMKPDFNIDLLCTVNYICHLFVVKREILEKTGGLRKEFDGAQDYDFIFRCTEVAGKEQIYHIPRILYHWRCHEDSTAENPESKLYAFEAGKKAIEAHFQRIEIPVEISQGEFLGLYRTKYLQSYDPLISILIPNKDHIEDLKRCMDSIDEKSTYRNYEYIIIENNSVEEETFAFYKKLEQEKKNVTIVYWDGEFNYSAINNFGAKSARGEYYLLLNNDTEIINPDCLEELLGYCTRPDVGAVGARLYYEDDTIQHAGVVIGFGGIAGHCFVMQPKGTTGYCHRIICAQDYSAVTAACMMVKKEAFWKVDGLSTELKVAFNDIDFCMKLGKAGYLVVYNPYAELYHYESKSRGLEDTPEKVARFNREIAAFEKRWPEILRDGDPYYNPNLTLKSQDFSLKRIKKG